MRCSPPDGARCGESAPPTDPLPSPRLRRESETGASSALERPRCNAHWCPRPGYPNSRSMRGR
eukprot:8481642-Pyramimonas_sp.AAC.1